MVGYPGVKHTQVLGRIYMISPCQGECLGPQSFVDLKTVNGDLCSSFHEACLKLGLLEDNN